LEGDDGAGVLDAGNDLHLFIHEMADIGRGVDIEFRQQIEFARGRIDFRRDFRIRQAVGDLVGLAELAFDLDEERNHSALQHLVVKQSSKKPPVWQAGGYFASRRARTRMALAAAQEPRMRPPISCQLRFARADTNAMAPKRTTALS